MKYKFYLNLDVYEDTTEIKIKPISLNRIEATDFIQLLSQFSLLIATLQRDLYIRENKGSDDDIPF